MRETEKRRIGGDARPPAGTHHGCCGLQWHEIIRDAAQLASVGPNTSRVGYGSGPGGDSGACPPPEGHGRQASALTPGGTLGGGTPVSPAGSARLSPGGEGRSCTPSIP